MLTPSRRAWAGDGIATIESGAPARAAARAKAARREARGGVVGGGGAGEAASSVAAGLIEFFVVVVARVGNAALCVPDFDAAPQRR